MLDAFEDAKSAMEVECAQILKVANANLDNEGMFVVSFILCYTIRNERTKNVHLFRTINTKCSNVLYRNNALQIAGQTLADGEGSLVEPRLNLIKNLRRPHRILPIPYNNGNNIGNNNNNNDDDNNGDDVKQNHADRCREVLRAVENIYEKYNLYSLQSILCIVDVPLQLAELVDEDFPLNGVKILHAQADPTETKYNPIFQALADTFKQKYH